MIGLRGLVIALVVAFLSGTAVGATAAHSRSDPRLSACQKYLGQNRPNACELLENTGVMGGP